ncbi:unnamed protein product [Menidia menidia]|uniref:(Atlantic silverside) hypothetical protein n=1 Tax=Menidia menidia TaxID=238744 RepID=A0A8S4AL56_9TELE|nr:unnamed protein product [Menidia menidia]
MTPTGGGALTSDPPEPPASSILTPEPPNLKASFPLHPHLVVFYSGNWNIHPSIHVDGRASGRQPAEREETRSERELRRLAQKSQRRAPGGRKTRGRRQERSPGRSPPGPGRAPEKAPAEAPEGAPKEAQKEPQGREQHQEKPLEHPEPRPPSAFGSRTGETSPPRPERRTTPPTTTTTHTPCAGGNVAVVIGIIVAAAFLLVIAVIGFILYRKKDAKRPQSLMHSWKAFYTGSSGLSEFPEFVALNLLDDEVMGYFDSKTNRFEAKKSWMMGTLGQEYVERQTNILLGHSQTFKGNVGILKERFNQSGGSNVAMVIGIIVAAAFLLVIAVIGFILYRKKDAKRPPSRK